MGSSSVHVSFYEQDGSEYGSDSASEVPGTALATFVQVLSSSMVHIAVSLLNAANMISSCFLWVALASSRFSLSSSFFISHFLTLLRE